MHWPTAIGAGENTTLLPHDLTFQCAANTERSLCFTFFGLEPERLPKDPDVSSLDLVGRPPRELLGGAIQLDDSSIAIEQEHSFRHAVEQFRKLDLPQSRSGFFCVVHRALVVGFFRWMDAGRPGMSLNDAKSTCCLRMLQM